MIGMISMIIKIAYEWYKKCYGLNVETSFVKINDPKCNCLSQRPIKSTCDSTYCPHKMMKKIISKIDEATESIDIAMYNFTNSDLARVIIRARQRGVKIRIIVDKSTYENEDSNQSQAATLLRNGNA